MQVEGNSQYEQTIVCIVPVHLFCKCFLLYFVLELDKQLIPKT